ncbi:MAG: MMPL family transporter [Planctomycetes bacterium]|nr:MMPL family transporter [Planctomycetota bacterium]
MFHLLGKVVSRHWLLVMIAWAVVAAVLRLLAPSWDLVTHDGDLAYLPDRMTTVRGERLLAAAFPGNKSKSQFVIVAARDERPLSSEDLAALETLAHQVRDPALEPELPLVDAWTPASDVVGQKLISPDRRAALAVMQLSTEFMALQNIPILDRISRQVNAFAKEPSVPAGLHFGVTGSAAVGGDMQGSAGESIKNTELVTVLLVLSILAVVYRAPVLVLIPLLTLMLSVVVASDAVALLALVKQQPGWEWFDFQLFKTSKIFVVTILFGAGTDFCLFLIARYREELERGFGHVRAIELALEHVGGALAASALTTVLGLGTMIFADFGKYRNSGPAIGLCLLVALTACLTLAPAMLRALGQWVFWPRYIGVDRKIAAEVTGINDTDLPASTDAADRATKKFWSKIANLVVERPGLILATSVALLSPLAMAGWNPPISYNLLAELDPSRPSVHGTALLSKHFPPGETGPVTVLAHKDGAAFQSKEREQDIARMTKWMYDLPGVKQVRSYTEPLGDTPGMYNIFRGKGLAKLTARGNKGARAMYLAQNPELAGEVTRFDLILEYDPFSIEALHFVDRLDTDLQKFAADPKSPWHDVQFDFLGTSAATRDLKTVTEADRQLIQQLVVFVVMGVLMVLLRRPGLCLYLMISVLFSYFVTLGATHLLFSHWYPHFQGLDWKVPIFLFVILVAIGEDYNIFLVTRVIEEQAKHGALAGLRIAVTQTGGIITSCGVIMAGTFVSMMTGTLKGMLELGFALSIGIMLDTVVVRPILVPCYLAIVENIRGTLVQQRGATTDDPVEDKSMVATGRD